MMEQENWLLFVQELNQEVRHRQSANASAWREDAAPPTEIEPTQILLSEFRNMVHFYDYSVMGRNKKLSWNINVSKRKFDLNFRNP